MPFDEKLAERIRTVLARHSGVTERKMFGGIAFMLNGHMCCGIAKGDLMLRVGPEEYETILAKPHVRPMDFTGRPLTGMVYVDVAGVRSDAALRRWIEHAVAFARTLNPKKPK